jgi:hypothetical protein
VGALLESWPDLEKLQRCRPATLRKFFREHNCRGEERIEERIQSIQSAVAATKHPERSLFDSLPGAGPALMPRLIVAFGTDRERYGSAAEIQRYSGIAPVTERSGGSLWVHFRWACPKFVRQTFHEFARCSISQSEWARAFYQYQRDQRKSHHAAVRALAFKWIRIIFRCWKGRKPYDEAIYLQSLRKRQPRSSRRTSKAMPTGFVWKEIAGFNKFSVDSY